MPGKGFAVAISWICLLNYVDTYTIHASDSTALVNAITNVNVDTVLLLSDVRFNPADWPSDVYRLTRNLTITSADGPHKVVDFNARAVNSKLSIGAGYNLSFIHLTLKDTRYGAGADIDLLAASPDGILYLNDVAKWQHSCPPLVQQQILAYQRDPTVPGPVRNVISFPKHTLWNGVMYNDTILYEDFSTRMSGGENLAERGYVVHKNHSYKLCSKIVDPQCVAKTGSATNCIQQEMDADHFANHPQPTSQLAPAAKAGIAAAAAVAGAAVLAALAALLITRRKRKQQQQQLGLPVHGKHSCSKDRQSKGQQNTSTLHDVQCKAAAEHHDAVMVLVSNNSSGPSYLLGTGPCSLFSDGHGRSVGVTPVSGAITSTGSAPDTGQLAPGGSSDLGENHHRSSSAKLGAVPGCQPELHIVRGTLTREQAASIQLGSMVGAGSFGRVFRGRLGDDEVAIKVIHHNSQAAEKVSSEVEVMMRFDHPNLVKGHHYVTWGTAGVSQLLTRPESQAASSLGEFTSADVFMPVNGLPATGSGNGGRSLSGATSSSSGMLETWIITEFCNGSNLQAAAMMHNTGLFFTDGVPQMGIILMTLLGVARGMERLHSNNVLHGDLKAANVMLALSQGAAGSDALELVPKVADFGMSRVMAEGATHMSTHTMGTITHQPPELMRNGRLSKPADVYSFGVLMWEVIMARPPWQGKMMGEVLAAVLVDGKRLEFAPTVPKAYAELAQSCWREDPSMRPTFTETSRALEELLQQQQVLQDQAALHMLAA